MPGTRPYQTLSRERINTVAKQAWSERSTLEDLIHELEQRDGPEPDSLRFKLRQRVAEIGKRSGLISPSRSPELPPDTRAALRNQISQLEAHAGRLDEHAAMLRAELARARTRIEKLESELERRPSSGRLYAKVGLDERCPDFVLTAARTAYRKRFHPDHHLEPEKGAVEARFKEAEAVFDQLLVLRAANGQSKSTR